MQRSFLRHFVSKVWILVSESVSRVQCFTGIEENGGDKGLVELELACEADGVALPDPV